MYTTVGLLSGAIFFQEFQGMSALSLSMFFIGIAGMLAGCGLSISPDAAQAGLKQLLHAEEGSDEYRDDSLGASCFLPHSCSAMLCHTQEVLACTLALCPSARAQADTCLASCLHLRRVKPRWQRTSLPSR